MGKNMKANTGTGQTIEQPQETTLLCKLHLLVDARILLRQVLLRATPAANEDAA
jgi:hypothetical protein